MKLYVYLRYGKDTIGDYTEKIYSPVMVQENDELEYIGETDSHKIKDINDDTRTYI